MVGKIKYFEINYVVDIHLIDTHDSPGSCAIFPVSALKWGGELWVSKSAFTINLFLQTIFIAYFRLFVTQQTKH